MRLDSFLSPRRANYRPLSPLSLLWRTSETHADRIAVEDHDRRLTWSEFARWVRRIGGALRERGVRPGDVVSIVAPNSAELLAAHFAVPMIGGVLNAVNVRLDAASLAYILGHAESKLLIAHTDHAGLVARARRAAKSDVPVLWFGHAGRSAVESLDDNAPDDAWLSECVEAAPMNDHDFIDDEWQPICLNYTSGTTGQPKGVVYHHRGAYLNAVGNVLAMGFTAETRYLWVLPMFHCNGWTHTWAVTASGGTHLCLGHVDAPAILRSLAHDGVTHLCCAPTVLYMLVSEPAFALLELRRTVTVGTGGAAPSAKLLSELRSAGLQLTHLYGLTESFGPATCCALSSGWADLPLDEVAERLARQGAPHSLASDLVVIDASGREIPRDGKCIGEVVLRGNTLMAGYYRDRPATEAAFADDVFHTGDLAVRHPNGHIEIRDRAKDIIISGGENIASIEIEVALQRHASVLMAAVVALPDEKWGEVPCAFIELRPGAPEPTAAELEAHCRGYLAGFKIPKCFVFGEVPKTATGKVQKFALRRVAAELR